MYNYASILFTGVCNANCPSCIGKLPEFKNFKGNLSIYPLPGMEAFLKELIWAKTEYISFSGILADPQQYEHEIELINYLRKKLPGVVISLHTNGLLALKNMIEYRNYDRVTLSFPSFKKDIYKKMTGVNQIDLIRILDRSKLSVKLSMLLTEETKNDIDSYIEKARRLGIRRVVIRRMFGEKEKIKVFPVDEPYKYVYGNPVYDVNGVEVTVWDYAKSTVNALFLFPDGSVRGSFLRENA
jgi:MoaA/NifB/PqqE/SkfB family radical SAM enzyme